MQFAVQYSAELARLLRDGRVRVDSLKCPAWPHVIKAAQELRPVYVHFPLKVGRGIGDAIDTETSQPAAWGQVEALLVQTGTPLVNLHLSPSTEDHPGIPVDSANPADVERVTEHLIRDVQAVVRRFGPERVVVENDHDNGGRHLRPALLPQVIRRVVEATGCGFLLDLSHARLAARFLHMDVGEYLAALPCRRIRELHVTGLQHVDAYWTDRLLAAGIDARTVQHYAGRLIDHLPMTDDDWGWLDRALEQVRAGAWSQPWVLTFEYGGVGPLWEAVTDAAVLREQGARFYRLTKAGFAGDN